MRKPTLKMAVALVGVFFATAMHAAPCAPGLAIDGAVPPPSQCGPTSWPFERIALSGCSQTRDWIGDGEPTGFEEITGVDLFTDSTEFGGGDVTNWIAPNSTYMQLYTDAVTGTEDAILAQICVSRVVTTTYENVVTLINLIATEAPGRPIYLMPLDVSAESSGNCNHAGYEESVAFIDQAVEDGLALHGPAIDPLYANSETRDGCHPNDVGAARMTDTVVAWLEALEI